MSLAVTSSRVRYHCPAPDCRQNYPVRKSLNRHYNAIHLNKTFECKHCGKKFTRKDHKDRHEDETHDRPTRSVLCRCCNKVILARTLGDHQKTDAHIEAQARSNAEGRSIIRSGQYGNIEKLVDPLLLTAWLFYSVNMDNVEQGSWTVANIPCRPSVQVLELRDFTVRTLRYSMNNLQAHELSRLIRSVETLTITDAMIGDWESITHHKRGLQELRRQRRIAASTRAESVSQAEPTLTAVIDGFRDLACASPGEERFAIEDDAWYHKGVLHQGPACGHVQDPADHLIYIKNDVAIEYQEAPTDHPEHSYRHELKTDFTDAEALRWCWSLRQSSVTSTLSGPARLIRRNMHAFLCASTRTTFDTNKKVKCPIQRRIRHKAELRAELRAVTPSSLTKCAAWVARRTNRVRE